MLAANKGHAETVMLLLADGRVDVNMQDKVRFSIVCNRIELKYLSHMYIPWRCMSSYLRMGKRLYC